MDSRKIVPILLLLVIIACVIGIIGAAIGGSITLWTLILANLMAIALAIVILIERYM